MCARVAVDGGWGRERDSEGGREEVGAAWWMTAGASTQQAHKHVTVRRLAACVRVSVDGVFFVGDVCVHVCVSGGESEAGGRAEEASGPSLHVSEHVSEHVSGHVTQVSRRGSPPESRRAPPAHAPPAPHNTLSPLHAALPTHTHLTSDMVGRSMVRRARPRALIYALLQHEKAQEAALRTSWTALG